MSVNVILNFAHLLIWLLHVKVDAHQLNNKVLVAQNEFANHATFVLTKMALLLLDTNEVIIGKANTNVLIAAVTPLPVWPLVTTEGNSALQNQPSLTKKLIKLSKTEILIAVNYGRSLRLNAKTVLPQKSQPVQSSTNQFLKLSTSVATNTSANAPQNFAIHSMIPYVKTEPPQFSSKVNVA
jgi:hypothetical protein